MTPSCVSINQSLNFCSAANDYLLPNDIIEEGRDKQNARILTWHEAHGLPPHSGLSGKPWTTQQSDKYDQRLVKRSCSPQERENNDVWGIRNRDIIPRRSRDSLSCPFRQRNRARFNVREYRVCAMAKFSISGLKYVCTYKHLSYIINHIYKAPYIGLPYETKGPEPMP
jgi:hypothetical protein